MTELERIMDQSERAFEGDAWHGPSLMAILKDVSASQAASRVIGGAHSIWELVYHIGAWERAGIRRLGGDPANLTDVEDWPAVSDTTEIAWQQTKVVLRAGHHEFRTAISKLDESRLDQPIVAGLSTVYVTLHGIIQHMLYHAGQIAILKKALGKAQTNE